MRCRPVLYIFSFASCLRIAAFAGGCAEVPLDRRRQGRRRPARQALPRRLATEPARDGRARLSRRHHEPPLPPSPSPTRSLTRAAHTRAPLRMHARTYE
eukprot:6184607-Pleurochrysis_carterae.AAC.5